MSALDLRAPDAAAISDGQLHDAALRATRQPIGRLAVVLHLSRLPPPGPRPHHQRIARALMQDTAARFDGQVFLRQSGDLVLLCRRGQPPARIGANRVTTADPLQLPEVLARLLRADVADPARLVSAWNLEQDSEVLLAYTATRSRADGAVRPREDFAGQTSLIDALGRVVDQVNLGDVLQRQTAIILQGGPGEALVPLYRDITFSVPALETRLAETGQARIDPFLFRHLAARLDQRMLTAVAAAIGRGGPLDPVAEGGAERPTLQLNLTVACVVSAQFAALAAACRRRGARLAVALQAMDAAADTVRFDQARTRLAESGFVFVLGGVSHLSLLVANPGPWRPDLVKLDWSRHLSDLPEDDRLTIDQAVAELGVERVVLRQADTEAALHWGLSRGIRRFQGRHVDMMLAAARMVSCAGAPQCSLRQCSERATTTSPSGRAGCTNLPLLDHAAPITTRPRTAAMPQAAASAGAATTVSDAQVSA